MFGSVPLFCLQGQCDGAVCHVPPIVTNVFTLSGCDTLTLKLHHGEIWQPEA